VTGRLFLIPAMLPLLFLAASAGGADAVPARAADEDMLRAIQELQARLRQQEQRLAELEGRKSDANAAAAALAQAARQLVADAVARPGMPRWLDGLSFYGNLRLRYQNDCFSGEDVTLKPRNRFRYRIRAGIIKTWLDDQLETGFQLSGSETGDATTTNETMGDNFARDGPWINLAYASYRPKPLPGLTLTGGRMLNPLVQTDLVWDADVYPEGFWAGYRAKPCDTFEPFAGVGYFLLNENFKAPFGADADSAGHALDTTARDATLCVYQAGFAWTLAKDVKWTLAGTYYDHENIETGFRAACGNNTQTIAFPPPATGSYTRLAAGQFKVVNVLNKLDFRLLDLPWTAYFDILHNTANHDRGLYAEQDTAFAIGLKVGQNKKRGDWSLGYTYKYVEANSTLGELADGDFGGTNAKGSAWRAVYNLADFLTVGTSLFWFEPIAGPREDQRTVMTRVELIWSF
jgi:hypothetical protein